MTKEVAVLVPLIDLVYYENNQKRFNFSLLKKIESLLEEPLAKLFILITPDEEQVFLHNLPVLFFCDTLTICDDVQNSINRYFNEKCSVTFKENIVYSDEFPSHSFKPTSDWDEYSEKILVTQFLLLSEESKTLCQDYGIQHIHLLNSVVDKKIHSSAIRDLKYLIRKNLAPNGVRLVSDNDGTLFDNRSSDLHRMTMLNLKIISLIKEIQTIVESRGLQISNYSMSARRPDVEKAREPNDFASMAAIQCVAEKQGVELILNDDISYSSPHWRYDEVGNLSSFTSKLEHMDNLMKSEKLNFRGTVLVFLDDNRNAEISQELEKKYKDKWFKEYDCCLIAIPINSKTPNFSSEDKDKLNALIEKCQKAKVDTQKEEEKGLPSRLYPMEFYTLFGGGAEERQRSFSLKDLSVPSSSNGSSTIVGGKSSLFVQQDAEEIPQEGMRRKSKGLSAVCVESSDEKTPSC